MPKTKPISQHLADGTYRADRHAKRAEIEVGGATQLKAPSTLHPEHRRLWRAVVRTLEPTWLAQADAWLIVSLVEALTFQADAAARLQTIGTVVKTSAGDVHKSPYWSVWRQSAEQVRALSVKLGLSPGDRAKLIAIAGDPADTVDAGAVFEQLMRNHAASARVGDDDSQEAEEWE